MYMRVYTYLPMMIAGILACSAITLCRLCCIVTPRSCGELTLSTAKEIPWLPTQDWRQCGKGWLIASVPWWLTHQ